MGISEHSGYWKAARAGYFRSRADNDEAIKIHRRIAGAFFAHQSNPKGMTVTVEPGQIFSGAVITEIPLTITAPIVAPTTNPRIDRIIYNRDTGAVSVLTGSEAVSPVPPTLNTGLRPIAQLRLKVGQTEISDSDLTDERVGHRVSGGLLQDELITASAGQTVFTFTTLTYAPATGSLAVFVDGLKQRRGIDYNETSPTSITFTSPLQAGMEVEALGVNPNQVAGTIAAANVSYTPAGVGAVATNVKARLDQIVSVKNFGAVGDGVTDDVTAIQLAVDTANAAGGATVYFPPGTYIVGIGAAANIGINLKSNIRYLGAGIGATTIKAKPSAGSIHLLRNATAGLSNVTIEHMTLDHNGVNIGATAGVHCLALKEFSVVHLSHLAIKNSDHHGITTLTDSQDTANVNNDLFISDIYLENIGVGGRQGGDGIRAFNGLTRAVIQNIVGNNIEYHGIHIAKGQCTVNNVILRNVGNAAISPQSEGCTVSNVDVKWDASFVIADLAANRPAAGTAGIFFYATDTGIASRDNGVDWKTASFNPSILWAITRSGFATGQKSAFSNIKGVFELTENQPYNPAFSDGVRIETNKCELTNIHVTGKFRFGAFLDTVNDTHISNVTVENIRQDGMRFSSANRATLSNWTVVTANVTAGANRGIRLTNCDGSHILNGRQLDGVNIGIAISEEGTTNNSVIVGNVINGTAAAGTRITRIGANTIVHSNPGYASETWGSQSISPDANGNGTITHNQANTPDFVHVAIRGDNAFEAVVQSVSSTTITVRIRDTTNNADVTTGSYTVDWEARRNDNF